MSVCCQQKCSKNVFNRTHTLGVGASIQNILRQQRCTAVISNHIFMQGHVDGIH